MEYIEKINALHAELGIPKNYKANWKLPIQHEASQTATTELSPNGEQILLSPGAKKRWLRLKSAALQDEVILHLEYGFRSIDQQANLIRGELAKGKPISEILTWIAAPGHSEHHTGRAIDVGTIDCFPVDESFEETEGYRWLQTHKKQFSIQLSYPRENKNKIIFEPWHWYFK